MPTFEPAPYDRKNTFRSLILVAAIAWTLVVGALPAAAHNVSSPVVQLLKFPDLTAEADGYAYERPGAVPAYAWEAKLFIFPGHTAGVKNWELWPVLDSSLSLKSFGVSKSYPIGSRPNEVNKTVGHVIYASTLEDFAVEKCSANAQMLRQQGKSDVWIFGRDHELSFKVELKLDYDIRYGADSHLNTGGLGNYTRKIHCKAAPAPTRVPTEPNPGPTRVPHDNSVASAYLLTLEKSAANGACQVTTSGVITSTVPYTTVKFRYADDAGHKSDVKTVKTDHSSTAMFSHKYNIPNNPNGGENGKIRIVGVSTPFESPWSNYALECVAKSPGGLASGPPPHSNSGLPEGSGNKTAPARRDLTDVAVTQLRVLAGPRGGSVAGRIENLGTQGSHFQYVLVVMDGDGTRVLRESGKSNLQPGTGLPIAFDFPRRRGVKYEATLTVRAAGDEKPGNNQRSAQSGR